MVGPLHPWATWARLVLLGYKPVQHLPYWILHFYTTVHHHKLASNEMRCDTCDITRWSFFSSFKLLQDHCHVCGLSTETSLSDTTVLWVILLGAEDALQVCSKSCLGALVLLLSSACMLSPAPATPFWLQAMFLALGTVYDSGGARFSTSPCPSSQKLAQEKVSQRTSLAFRLLTNVEDSLSS